VSLQEIESEFDWTYCTSYSGDLEIRSDCEEIDESDQAIPMAMLADQSISILWSATVTLFEDSLSDNGSCKFLIRCRVTPKYVYILSEYSLDLTDVGRRGIITRYYIDRTSPGEGIEIIQNIQITENAEVPRILANKIYRL
jgi:TIP41-like family